MPFLPFVLLLAWQAISKSASFALGWATAIYFGQVPGKQGRILAVISLASAAWVIVIIGFALPLLAGAILEALGVIDRNFQVEPLHVIGLWAAIVLTPPAIAGITVLAKFHDERTVGHWLRMIPVSYPATASLGAGVLQMVLFTPILVVRRWIKKQSLLQTALSMREDTDDDDLTETVTQALHGMGIDEVAVEEARGILAWPMRTVGFAARHLVGAVVRGDPMRLRADGLQLFAYATNVAVLGPSEDAHRARAALERELPFDKARLTWSEDAQDLEDAIVRAYRDAGDDLAELHAKLDRVQDRIDTESLNAEEWNILYRLRLQAEHEVFEREVRGGDDGGGNGRPAGRGDRPGVSGRTSGRRSRRP
jgi:hypothetical protein